jgi:hypothetical protein
MADTYHVKDHVVREVVNRLRDTALEFHAHGSLRERLARELEPLLVASRPAEVDDMMPVTEPVAWRHTLDEGSYFANGRNYQLLDDWDAAFADWMLHGGVLQSLYSGPDTHELNKEAKDERSD